MAGAVDKPLPPNIFLGAFQLVPAIPLQKVFFLACLTLTPSPCWGELGGEGIRGRNFWQTR
jgi:hypothetical protein